MPTLPPPLPPPTDEVEAASLLLCLATLLSLDVWLVVEEEPEITLRARCGALEVRAAISYDNARALASPDSPMRDSHEYVEGADPETPLLRARRPMPEDRWMGSLELLLRFLTLHAPEATRVVIEHVDPDHGGGRVVADA